jgi:hypothetical protein
VSSALAASHTPEESFLPAIEVLGLVNEGKYAGEDSNTVEGVSLGCEFGFRKGWVVLQGDEARGHGEDESFEILQRGVTSSANVGGREETEDVLDRLWQLPERGPERVICGNLCSLDQLEDIRLERQLGLLRTHGCEIERASRDKGVHGISQRGY